MNDILGLYNAYRQSVEFTADDIIPEYQVEPDFSKLQDDFTELQDDDLSIGSNNWVVNGEIMSDGSTYMANDPHRTVAIPSLRYLVHLSAPGWNVIGGGEPEIPGISIGHNEYGAWGLTVFRTDGEDLYVYDLDPKNLNLYQYQGEWEEMKVITESIKVKTPMILRLTCITRDMDLSPTLILST